MLDVGRGSRWQYRACAALSRLGCHSEIMRSLQVYLRLRRHVSRQRTRRVIDRAKNLNADTLKRIMGTVRRRVLVACMGFLRAFARTPELTALHA